MKDKITVITAIRNREAWRIKTMVESIRATGADPSFHIIDYGSSKEYALQYENLCKELNIKYTHMYSEGLPWNKCRALNFGVRKASTPYIVTSDVDVIYENNSFEYILNNFKNNQFYQIKSFWLPQDNNKEKAADAGTGSPGLSCFTTKKVFTILGGYDERFVYWGFEDLDWDIRLKRLNFKQIWIPDQYKIYHQWHPKSEAGNLRPACAESDSRRYFYENMANPVLKQNWGKPLTKKDRPILDYINNKKPFEFIVTHGELSNRLLELLEKAKSEKFIKVDLSPRYKEKPLKKFQKPISSFLQKTFLKGTGLVCTPELNNNFDVLYSVLNNFASLGLKDYYISSDCRYIYLLWK